MSKAQLLKFVRVAVENKLEALVCVRVSKLRDLAAIVEKQDRMIRKLRHQVRQQGRAGQ